MCGIIGYVGRRPCERLLLDGLRKLEYRGYDSAGIAWREGESAGCIKTVGNLDALEAAASRFQSGSSRRRDGDGRALRGDRTHTVGHPRRRH